MSPLSTLSALTDVIASYRAGAAGNKEAAKSCCAAVYGIDLVGLFLGDSYHPGGVDLSRRLAQLLDLHPGGRVLDIASGIGTTAMLLAAEQDVDVVGVDLGAAQVTRAAARATATDLADRVEFQVGDAEHLPISDGDFDAVVSECAFCTFPDKPTAAAEAARVLRPGGRLGLTDVWLDPAALEPDLSGLAGRIACIADARPIDHTSALLETAGFRVDHVERHDDALAATVELVQSRLRALRLLDLPLLRSFDLRRAVRVAGRVADVVDRGDAGYFLLTATKGAHRSYPTPATHIFEELLTVAVLEPTLGCRSYADRGSPGFAWPAATIGRRCQNRPRLFQRDVPGQGAKRRSLRRHRNDRELDRLAGALLVDARPVVGLGHRGYW